MEQSNQPTYIIFFIKEIKSKSADDTKKKSKWTRIGAGWELDSGRINTVMDLMPMGEGTIQLVPVELLDDNL